jgi:ribosomal protein S18 acetylase RimI-like enzyme
MTNDVLIRSFKSEDRQVIRQIACDTADMGEPVENFFGDREVVGDLLTRYYTDYEPKSLWVAEYEGKVIGYLTGCLNTRHYFRVMVWSLLPRIVIKSILRGVFLRQDTLRLFKSAIRTGWLGGFRRLIPVDKYPAHLHINVQKDFRNQNVGKCLVERFIEQVKRARLPGIHLAVHEDNVRARKFFEHIGFIELTQYPTVYTRKVPHNIVYAIAYGKEIEMV